MTLLQLTAFLAPFKCAKKEESLSEKLCSTDVFSHFYCQRIGKSKTLANSKAQENFRFSDKLYVHCWYLLYQKNCAIKVRNHACFDVKTWWISAPAFCPQFQQNIYVKLTNLIFMKSHMTNLKDCENRFFLNWSAKEWKFGKQGPFCLAFVLTSKPDEIAVQRFASISTKIYNFNLPVISS